MRRKCGLTPLIFQAGSFLLFFIFPRSVFSQTAPDSVAEEVIVVKKPPVAAAYAFRILYDYTCNQKAKTGNRNYFSSGPEFFPPQPVSVYHIVGDSIDADSDSSRAMMYAKKNDRPVAFDFMAYASTIGYYFSATDSVKLDSASFEYEVDKKGNVNFKPLARAAADSSCRNFESQALPVMRKLWRWYPAEKPDDKNEIQKVPCFVTITIYAYDPASPDPPDPNVITTRNQ